MEGDDPLMVLPLEVALQVLAFAASPPTCSKRRRGPLEPWPTARAWAQHLLRLSQVSRWWREVMSAHGDEVGWVPLCRWLRRHSWPHRAGPELAAAARAKEDGLDRFRAWANTTRRRQAGEYQYLQLSGRHAHLANPLDVWEHLLLRLETPALRVYDIRTGLGHFHGGWFRPTPHGFRVLAYQRDGRGLVRHMAEHDLASGALVRRLIPPTHHPMSHTAARWTPQMSPNGRWLASVPTLTNVKTDVHICDLAALDQQQQQDGDELQPPPTMEFRARWLRFHPTCDMVAAVDWTEAGSSPRVSTVTVYDLGRAAAAVARATLPPGVVAVDVAFNADALAVVDSEAQLRLFPFPHADVSDDNDQWGVASDDTNEVELVGPHHHHGEPVARVLAGFATTEQCMLRMDERRLYFFADFKAGRDNAVLIFDVAALLAESESESEQGSEGEGKSERESDGQSGRGKDWRRALVARLPCGNLQGVDEERARRPDGGTNQHSVDDDESGFGHLFDDAVVLGVGHRHIVAYNNASPHYSLFSFAAAALQ